jgi:hypothetical protein
MNTIFSGLGSGSGFGFVSGFGSSFSDFGFGELLVRALLDGTGGCLGNCCLRAWSCSGLAEVDLDEE